MKTILGLFNDFQRQPVVNGSKLDAIPISSFIGRPHTLSVCPPITAASYANLPLLPPPASLIHDHPTTPFCAGLQPLGCLTRLCVTDSPVTDSKYFPPTYQMITGFSKLSFKLMPHISLIYIYIHDVTT